MTTTDIENAFNNAIENGDLKKIPMSKSKRYQLKNREITIAKKLEILFKLDKLRLADEPITETNSALRSNS